MDTWRRRHGDMELLGKFGSFTKKSTGKLITEAQTIFLNLFTICSSCERKFVVSPFVDEETNRSYPFANGLKGLAHLCWQHAEWVVCWSGESSHVQCSGSNRICKFRTFRIQYSLLQLWIRILPIP
jgi:hypothetical protein